MHNVRLVLLGSWLGGAVLFSAVVAPTTFRVLRNFNLPNAGEVAGTIVSHTLSVVNTSAFSLGLLLIALGLVWKQNYSRRNFTLQIVMLAIVTIAGGVGEWVIAARMRALRAAMVLPIDQVPLDDARRVAFAALHGYSVAALSLAMIAALVGFFLIASRARATA